MALAALEDQCLNKKNKKSAFSKGRTNSRQAPGVELNAVGRTASSATSSSGAPAAAPVAAPVAAAGASAGASAGGDSSSGEEEVLESSSSANS